MWRLHQFPLCPFSRAVRFAMAEKAVSAELVLTYPWERSETLSSLNPAIQTPVLENGQLVLCDSNAIIEYFDETVERPPLLGASATERAEARRLAGWFAQRFFRHFDLDDETVDATLGVVLKYREDHARVRELGVAEVRAAGVHALD